jgi:uncharacterized lipoprotein YmbA
MKKNCSTWPALALVALVALVAGCASSTPAPVLLNLPPAGGPVAANAPAAPASAPLLAVRRVEIPEYLIARRVRYRADAATLAEWPNTYWAERIEMGVSREFVSALRRQLPGWPICDANCGDQGAALNLVVTITPMDFVRSSRALQSRARITVGPSNAVGSSTATQELALDTPADADTAQGHAQAISTLLQKLAAEAAPMVRAAKP